MEGTAKIEGLEAAMKSMQTAFPDNIKQQARIVNGAMGGAARKSILPIAKQLALNGDGSGALSDSLGVRAQKARSRKGKAGGMMVVPVRSDKKALAKYIDFYFTAQGKTPPADIVTQGIRHGHLIEFGTSKISSRAYLWPAAQSGLSMYINLFAGEMRKRTEAAVKREAKKKAKR